MALTTSKINMQVHYGDSSEGEEFGYPSDAEWQRNAPIQFRGGDMEGLDELGLRTSLFELNSDKAICPKDKIYYHTGEGNSPVPVSSARIKELPSRIKGKSHNAGYIATRYEAIPAPPEQRERVCGIRSQHEGVGLAAQRCKKARLSL